MEDKVIFRDRQELQGADLNNIQEYTDKTLQDIIKDSITTKKQYQGLQVIMKSTTEIDVAPGRLWMGDVGNIYTKLATETVSVFSYLPVSDKKYIAVHVYGEENDIDIEPRDFLTDITTGQTEPSSVAMKKARQIVVEITSGLESAEPQKPAVPTGKVLIAYVLLDSSGIVSIENNTGANLPRVHDVNVRLKDVEQWRAVAKPKIETLSSELAGLTESFSKVDSRDKFAAVVADVARLKELLNIPDTYGEYAADHFLDVDESDTVHLEYDAIVEEGVRFNWDNRSEVQPDLFNPLDSNIEQSYYNNTGFLLPTFEDEVRLQTTGFAGELSISQYQFQTHEFKKGTIVRERIRFGEARTVCTNSQWWRSGQYDPITGIFEKDGETFQVFDKHSHKWFRIKQFWKDEYEDEYWYTMTTTDSINGSQVAQTFLNSNSGWLTKLGLYFTQIDANGTVYMHICETKNGKPVMERCIGSTSVAAGDINLHPEETVFDFPEPIYLKSGRRYAIVLTTGGDHYVAVVSGEEFTQGTLFYSSDGAYFQGDFTKDLMMNFYYASFEKVFTHAQLQTQNLSGGITDIDILANAVVPKGTELMFEYQYNGIWYTIDDENDELLAGLPSTLPMRVTFIGSKDVMPAFKLQGSVVWCSRPKVTFKHISAERTLGTPTESIEVQALLEEYEEVEHDLTIKLEVGGVEVAHTTVEDVQEPSGIRRTATFDYTADPQAAYKIIFEGSTSSALNVFHVAERIDIAY